LATNNKKITSGIALLLADLRLKICCFIRFLISVYLLISLPAATTTAAATTAGRTTATTT
jgi:hypothetical protein